MISAGVDLGGKDIKVLLFREGKILAKEEVLAVYCAATASRVRELMDRVGVEPDLTISGGIAKNRDVVERIEKLLKVKFCSKAWQYPEYTEKNIPFDNQIAGAAGAALFAKALAEKFKK